MRVLVCAGTCGSVSVGVRVSACENVRGYVRVWGRVCVSVLEERRWAEEVAGAKAERRLLGSYEHPGQRGDHAADSASQRCPSPPVQERPPNPRVPSPKHAWNQLILL